MKPTTCRRETGGNTWDAQHGGQKKVEVGTARHNPEVRTYMGEISRQEIEIAVAAKICTNVLVKGNGQICSPWPSSILWL